MSEDRTERIHFIGIGGAGMSGIALVLHQRGYAVTGSDLKESRYVRKLQDAGIPITIGHRPETIDEITPDIVVISSAIPDSNPELVRARTLDIPVWPRAKMLSFLSVGKQTVAVAGTHGKTTTSSMIAVMLDRMGLDPAFLIGGVIGGYGTNGRDGKGDFFVAEADESDGSFMFLNPNVAVVTNIDKDHLDHYGTMERLRETFAEFMALTGDDGSVVVMGDDEGLVGLARSTGCPVTTYGFGEGNDYVCAVTGTHGLATEFLVTAPDGRRVQMSLGHNPGRHNVLDATAAIAVAGILGLDLDDAARALSQFEGVGRRFTLRGEADSVTVVDDYGHHPTEIANTLGAASSLGFGRVVCVFQPHRYTRTQSLMEEFGHAFDSADRLYMMEVFPAGEEAIPGVSGRVLAAKVEEAGGVPVTYVPGRKDLIETLGRELEPGDLVIMQGAGDITMLIPLLLGRLGERAGEQDGQGKETDGERAN